MSRRYSHRSPDRYRLRIQICLAATLVLFIAVVSLWPSPSIERENEAANRVPQQEIIDVEEVRQTSQARRAPPPPSPPIPILVPDDVELEEQDLDLAESNVLDVEDTGEDDGVNEGSDSVPNSDGVTVGPQAVRFVEPEYTREARRNRVRAELVVEVLVDDRGRVQDTSIEERFILDKSGESKTPVQEVGYGLEEAAVSAARRWIFRPARENGKPVASYTTLTFTFGV